jgi:hypothetical protein
MSRLPLLCHKLSDAGASALKSSATSSSTSIARKNGMCRSCWPESSAKALPFFPFLLSLSLSSCFLSCPLSPEDRASLASTDSFVADPGCSPRLDDRLFSASKTKL